MIVLPLVIGAVKYCCVRYKLPKGIKAAWSLGQAYYSGGPTEILADLSNKVEDRTVIRDCFGHRR